MKEQTKIDLTREFTSQLGDARDKKSLILQFLQEQKAVILRLVGDYYYTSRGKVHGLKVSDEVNFTNETSGSFTVRYDVNFTNGCQDVSYDHEDQRMEMKFLLDLEHSILHLSGEEIPERGPDEF